MVKLREERPEDGAAIESLLDLCFGQDRFAKASYQFRQGVDAIAGLSFVAVDDFGNIAGTIRYWPIKLADRYALLLGPIAVAPHLHKRGIGRALVFTSLARADDLGFGTIFLVGEHGYYARFGFTTAPSSVVMPNEQPDRLQFRLLGDADLPECPCIIEPMPQSQECPLSMPNLLLAGS